MKDKPSRLSEVKFALLVALVVALGFAIASGFQAFSIFKKAEEPPESPIAALYRNLPFPWPPKATDPAYYFAKDAGLDFLSAEASDSIASSPAAGSNVSAGSNTPISSNPSTGSKSRPPEIPARATVRIPENVQVPERYFASVRIPEKYASKPNSVISGVEYPMNPAVGYAAFGSSSLPVYYSTLHYYRRAVDAGSDPVAARRGSFEIRSIEAADATKMSDTEKKAASESFTKDGYSPSILLPSGERVIPTGELHVLPDENVSEDEFLRAVAGAGLEVLRRATETDPWWLIKTASDLPDRIFSAAGDLSGRVRAQVEPNWYREVKRRFVPSDPYFKKQWHLENTGQSGGTAGADIAAVAAWDAGRGSAQVIVAVFDDGFDIGHTDLPSGSALVFSRDFVRGTTTPTPADADPREPDDHGTSVWGLIASPHGNSRGGAGVAPGCRWMLLRTPMELDERGIADAIRWAADKGAHVMSNSWGYADPAKVVTDAIAYARKHGRNGKGTLVLFASGNENADIGKTNDLSNDQNVLSIGATTNQDKRTTYSNYGDRLFAVTPAGYSASAGLVTTDRRGVKGYTGTSYTDASGNQFDGTSGACPIAAGIAALVFSVDPERTAAEVEAILRETAEKIHPSLADYDAGGHSRKYGYGRLNANAAALRAIGGGAGNVLFKEDFEARAVGVKSGSGAWSLSGGGAGAALEVALVSGNKFLRARDLAAAAEWKTKVIDIAGLADVTIRAKFAEIGTLEAADAIEGYYQVDNGAPVRWFSQIDDAGSAYQEKSVSGISGSRLVIWINFTCGMSEEWRLDDIEVSGTATSSAPKEGGLFREDFGTLELGAVSSPGKWSLKAGDGAASSFGVASVSGNKFLLADAVGEGATFRTSPIDISGHPAVTLKLKYAEVGALEPADAIEGYYQLDSKAPVKWFTHADDAGSAFQEVSVTGLSGYSLLAWVNFSSGADEAWRVDDVEVLPASAGAPAARRRYGSKVAFRESFDSRAIGTTGVSEKWSTDIPEGTEGSIKVSEARRDRFVGGTNLRGTGSWTTSPISIAGLRNVGVHMHIAEVGTMEPSDYIKGYYRLNGGEQIPWFVHQGQIAGGARGREISLAGISGQSIELIIEFRNSSMYEEWRIDDIMISEE